MPTVTQDTDVDEMKVSLATRLSFNCVDKFKEPGQVRGLGIVLINVALKRKLRSALGFIELRITHIGLAQVKN